MKKILICTDLIISNFTEIILNVIQIHNNWNSYFFNNFDDVMKQNEKNITDIDEELVMKINDQPRNLKKKVKVHYRTR